MGTPDDEAALQMTEEAETAEDLIKERDLKIKMLMSSRDVGSIIGKGGITIKTLREQSGAKITCSSSKSTSSERLVTITGNKESICKAFEAIVVKIEQDQAAVKQPIEGVGVAGGVDASTILLRLVIHDSQCHWLIGKRGSKIKKIQETTGASIQVAGETLPNSTEKAVTVSGSRNALSMAISQITNIMLENPPRGPFIPYKPHAPPKQTSRPQVTVGVANGGHIRDRATAHYTARDGSSTCNLKDLMNYVASKIPSKWRSVGIQLGLPMWYSKLKEIIAVACPHYGPNTTTSHSMEEGYIYSACKSNQMALSYEAGPSRATSYEAGPSRATSYEAVASRATSYEAGPSRATSYEAGPSRATSYEAGPSRATSYEAGPSRATSYEAGPSRATSYEAVASRATSYEAGPSRATSYEAGPSRATSYEAGPSRATSYEAVASRATSYEAGPSYATSYEAVASRATSYEAGPSRATSYEAGPSHATSYEAGPSHATSYEASLHMSLVMRLVLHVPLVMRLVLHVPLVMRLLLHMPLVMRLVLHVPLVMRLLLHVPLVMRLVLHVPLVMRQVLHMPLVMRLLLHMPLVMRLVLHVPLVMRLVLHVPLVMRLVLHMSLVMRLVLHMPLVMRLVLHVLLVERLVLHIPPV
ncbi:hypothetical protein EMCRGX_G033773 [Ephydatia muelleri]